jgi:2-hydroxy fatty acid dioxygenase
MTVIIKPNKKEEIVLLPAVPDRWTVGFFAAHAVQAAIFYHCVKSAVTDFDNAETALAFYGVYHREPWNQAIHFFGVPLIIWTMMIFAAHVVFSNNNKLLPLLDFLPGIRPHRVTWATLWVLMYVVFYLSIDVPGACMFAPWLYFMYATAVHWTANDQWRYYHSNKGITHWLGTGRLLQVALAVHVASWYIQIHAGHTIIEGAKPASLVNLGGALTAAPLFAFYEGVWFVGFRKEFQQRIVAQVAVYTQELCSQGANLRVCATL